MWPNIVLILNAVCKALLQYVVSRLVACVTAYHAKYCITQVARSDTTQRRNTLWWYSVCIICVILYYIYYVVLHML